MAKDDKENWGNWTIYTILFLVFLAVCAIVIAGILLDWFNKGSKKNETNINIPPPTNPTPSTNPTVPSINPQPVSSTSIEKDNTDQLEGVVIFTIVIVPLSIPLYILYFVFFADVKMSVFSQNFRHTVFFYFLLVTWIISQVLCVVLLTRDIKVWWYWATLIWNFIYLVLLIPGAWLYGNVFEAVGKNRVDKYFKSEVSSGGNDEEKGKIKA